MPALLLLAAWLVQFGPDAAESVGIDYFAAQTLVEGLEVAGLWCAVALWLSARPAASSLPARAGAWCSSWAAWWCCVEGLERAGCRMAFDITRPMPDSTVNTCDLATGLPMTWVSIAAAVALASLAAETLRR